MSEIEIGEVLKEFEVYVPSLPHLIKGRVTKYTNKQGLSRYDWSISHHYQPAAGAGVYFPSKVSCESVEEAEALFKAYAGSFVPSFKIVANESF